MPWLLVTERIVAPADTARYVQLWIALREIAQGARGHAWLFQPASVTALSSYLEFIEFGERPGTELMARLEQARESLDRAFQPTKTSEWTEARILE